MPNVSIEELKRQFSAGAKPSEQDFHNLIDTFVSGSISAGGALSLLEPTLVRQGIDNTQAVTAAGVAAFFNYQLASLGDAQAGISSRKIMTPRRTKEAISHFARQSHYTKSQIGSFFENTTNGKLQTHWNNVTAKPTTFTPSNNSVSSNKLQDNSVAPAHLIEEYPKLIVRYERDTIKADANYIVLSLELDDYSTYDRPLGVYILKVVGGGGFYFEVRLHFHRIGSESITCVLDPIIISYQSNLYASRVNLSLDYARTLYKTTTEDRTPHTSLDTAWYQNIYIRSISSAVNLNNYSEGYYFMLTRLAGNTISNFYINSYRANDSKVMITTPNNSQGKVILAPRVGTKETVERIVRIENPSSNFIRISYLSLSGTTFSLVNPINTPYNLLAKSELNLRIRMVPYSRDTASNPQRVRYTGILQFYHDANNIISPTVIRFEAWY